MKIKLTLTSLVFLFCVSCASQPFVWVNQLPPEGVESRRAVIEHGDRIQVLVEAQERMSGEFAVHEDGTYSQPVLGPVLVEGMTPQQVADSVAKKLKDIVVEPRVSVSVVAQRPLRIAVLGEVKQAGTFDVSAEETVLAAIARAGGLTEFADTDDIYVVRRAPTLARIRFDLRQMTSPDQASARFRLREGDVIVAE